MIRDHLQKVWVFDEWFSWGFLLCYGIYKKCIICTHFLCQCPTSIPPENIRFADAFLVYRSKILVVNTLKRINMLFLKRKITFMNKNILKNTCSRKKRKKMLTVQFSLLMTNWMWGPRFSFSDKKQLQFFTSFYILSPQPKFLIVKYPII